MKQFFSLKATITCAIIAVLTLTLLQAVLLPGMDQRVSDDAKSGIPAINDPAAAAQDQYGKMAQGAGVGAGSGAALGGAIGAAGGPAAAAVGAAVGGLSGAAAGGLIGDQRSAGGDAVSMKGVAENLSGGNADKTVGANFDTNSPGVTS